MSRNPKSVEQKSVSLKKTDQLLISMRLTSSIYTCTLRSKNTIFEDSPLFVVSTDFLPEA
jgi:hypothetical protein